MNLEIVEFVKNLWALDTTIGIYYFSGAKQELEKELELELKGRGLKNEFSFDESKLSRWLTDPKNSDVLEPNKNENKKSKYFVKTRKIKLEKIKNQ